MRPLAATALLLVLVAGCDGEVAIDCASRAPEACNGGPCVLTGRDGCRARCEEDEDCLQDGTQCEERGVLPDDGAAQTEEVKIDSVCVPE